MPIPSPGELAVLIPIIMVSIPVVAIVTNHQRRMLEIKLGAQNKVSDAAHQEIAALRDEIASLRETTTRFDLSFDAALDSVDQRLSRVELRQAGSVGANTREELQVTLRGG